MDDHPTTKPALFCPVCHAGALAARASALACPACGQEFPIIDGVPVLINDANSVFALADYHARTTPSSPIYGGAFDDATSLRGLYRRATVRLGLLGTGIIRHPGPPKAIATVARRVARPRVLVIGCGEIRYSQDAIFTYTDVVATPGIDAVADAHDLPFDDASFDLVIAVAVLEHVADPQRVVSEIWRVLAADGMVYANTPFLQPVHMGAYDFTRFTYLGHRRLFRYFHDIDSGMSIGPGAAAASALRHVALSLSDRPAWQRLANPLAMLLFAPLKYLDHWCRHGRDALDSAWPSISSARNRPNRSLTAPCSLSTAAASPARPTTETPENRPALTDTLHNASHETVRECAVVSQRRPTAAGPAVPGEHRSAVAIRP